MMRSLGVDKHINNVTRLQSYNKQLREGGRPMDEEIRRESSVPVQARVSIVDLARMDLYWRRVESVHIRTMSQLVSWTFTALVEVIEKNGKMPEDAASDVLSAHKYLEARGLYQQSLRKRSESKIVAALGFENLRKQGSDPRFHSSAAHKVIHSKHSVKPFDGDVNVGSKFESDCDIDWEAVDKKVAEEKEKERKQEVEEAIEAARKSGRLAGDSSSVNKEECVKESSVKVEGLRRMSNKECDEWEEDILERDEKRKTLENAPIDPGDFKIVKE